MQEMARKAISSGSSSVDSGTSPLCPKRKSSPKIMKRFHSSGTASGNIEVMFRWKRIIPMIAMVLTVSLSTVIRSSGQPNS